MINWKQPPPRHEQAKYARAADADCDVVVSPIARALYDYGPCSAQTVAAVIGSDDSRSLGMLFSRMAEAGSLSHRVVMGVDLYWLRGFGVG